VKFDMLDNSSWFDKHFGMSQNPPDTVGQPGVAGVIGSFFTVAEVAKIITLWPWHERLSNSWKINRCIRAHCMGVFGHPHHGGNGEKLTHIEFTLQHTDYKSVGAYRKFSSDHLKYQIISSSMRISKPNNDFTRYYSA
jgi:hypothetical protein